MIRLKQIKENYYLYITYFMRPGLKDLNSPMDSDMYRTRILILWDIVEALHENGRRIGEIN